MTIKKAKEQAERNQGMQMGTIITDNSKINIRLLDETINLQDIVISQQEEIFHWKSLCGKLWSELQKWHGKPYEKGCKCCELQERTEKELKG